MLGVGEIESDFYIKKNQPKVAGLRFYYWMRGDGVSFFDCIGIL